MKGFGKVFCLFGIVFAILANWPINAAPQPNDPPAKCDTGSSTECHNCIGPWSYVFDVRGWQVGLRKYIWDKEAADRFEQFANNSQTTKAAVNAGVELWLHYQSPEFQNFVRNFTKALAEEADLFHENFINSNGTSAEAKEAFQKILEIEKNDLLSISQECDEIKKVLSANVKACHELRKLQPYETLVKKQITVNPLPKTYVLGRLEQEEQNELAEIFHNFKQPKSKTKQKYFEWANRQTPAIRAMAYALIEARKLENMALLEKAKTELSEKNYIILKEIEKIYYDDNLSVREECEKIAEKRSKLDARTLKLESVSAFTNIGENCDKNHRQHFFSVGFDVGLLRNNLFHVEIG